MKIRARRRLSGNTLTLSLVPLFVTGCIFGSSGTATMDAGPPPAHPPAACTVTAASSSLCTSGSACPVVTDTVIACAQDPQAIGQAAGPMAQGQFAVITPGINDQYAHAQFAALNTSGLGTFQVDPIPPTDLAGVSSVTVALDPSGAPVFVTMSDNGIQSTRGSPGAYMTENLPITAGSSGLGIAGAAIASDGTEYVLATGQGSYLLRRDPASGAWSSNMVAIPNALPANYPAALTLGADGTPYVASVANVSSNTAPNGAMDILTLAVGTAAPVTVSTLANTSDSSTSVTRLSVLVATAADGTVAPVIAASGLGAGV